uniref:Uncharacterized protein n=1 Tax=Myoviridae sp. ct3Pt8 TaxID=2826608 RepID=A0A8S5MMJ1_9CAUD|nr:MAG TPA: hypothetical protein [Myoviridae sp. ct3Pt8]
MNNSKLDKRSQNSLFTGVEAQQMRVGQVKK